MDEDNVFDEILGTPLSIPLGGGEGLVVKGSRQKPFTITMTGDSEKDPDRDAIMLEALLYTQLDPTTFSKLCHRLYTLHILPAMEMSRVSNQIKEALDDSPSTPTRKKTSKKSPPIQ